MRAHEWLPVILAVSILPLTIWSGITGFSMSLHPPTDNTESETLT